MLTKHTLFRPSKVETKADSIAKIAKGITEADTSAREAKTQRLRAARLERDASEKTPKTARPQKTSQKTSPAKPKSED